VSEHDVPLSAIQQVKYSLRKEFSKRAHGLSGRAAEILRRNDAYRRARQLFVPPVPLLRQVRINSLLDGKELIVPAPGLKDGFYLLSPYSIPFQQLPYSVSMKGIVKTGHRLTRPEIESLSVSLLVAEAEAVDLIGNRLGNGLGFFDLSVAILAEMGALSTDAVAVACINQARISTTRLPTALWDVPVSMVFSEQQIFQTKHKALPSCRIFWEYLSAKKIRKINPLWWLHQARSI